VEGRFRERFNTRRGVATYPVVGASGPIHPPGLQPQHGSTTYYDYELRFRSAATPARARGCDFLTWMLTPPVSGIGSDLVTTTNQGALSCYCNCKDLG